MAFPILAALAIGGLAAGGAVAGSLIQSRAQKRSINSANEANEIRYARALGIGKEGELAADRYATRGRELFDQRIGMVAGFQTQALGEIQKIGGTARRDIKRREAGFNSQVQQGATSRGLSNTTVVDAGRRGVFEDTNRALLDLDERLGALRSGALHTFSNAMERVTGDRASFEGEVFRSKFSALQSILNTITERQDVPYTPQPVNYAAIGQGVGNLASLALMAGSSGGGAGVNNSLTAFGGGFNPAATSALWGA